jgi:hypothetical protein
LAEWAFSPFPNWQLQHAGVEDVFPFSGHSLCRWPPSHNKKKERFLAVGPNVAELLAVLRKTILSYIDLYPDCDVARVWEFENFL